MMSLVQDWSSHFAWSAWVYHTSRQEYCIMSKINVRLRTFCVSEAYKSICNLVDRRDLKEKYWFTCPEREPLVWSKLKILFAYLYDNKLLVEYISDYDEWCSSLIVEGSTGDITDFEDGLDLLRTILTTAIEQTKHGRTIEDVLGGFCSQVWFLSPVLHVLKYLKKMNVEHILDGNVLESMSSMSRAVHELITRVETWDDSITCVERSRTVDEVLLSHLGSTPADMKVVAFDWAYNIRKHSGDRIDSIRNTLTTPAVGVAHGIEIPDVCHGTQPPSTTSKYDTDKLRYDLICPEIDHALAEVFTAGVKKYSARNCEKGANFTWGRWLGAAKRHLSEWEKCNEIDEETGCRHLAQAIWNLGLLLTYQERGIGIDDRSEYYKNKVKK